MKHVRTATRLGRLDNCFISIDFFVARSLSAILRSPDPEQPHHSSLNSSLLEPYVAHVILLVLAAGAIIDN
ncbi:uncharacterized protein BDW70DRAFT_83269 [Aspergillus foveolatus]|uniref:uncharacterized protein n=1 Tax=Aspergillus foveolatus TaxID=210207 RepID=UPI003CCDA0F6